jgi:hypothetical protein
LLGYVNNLAADILIMPIIGTKDMAKKKAKSRLTNL